MSKSTSKQRAFASSTLVELIQPSDLQMEKAKKAVASLTAEATPEDIANFVQSNKQEDLMYFKAVYATCGFNLNDDVFLDDEFWNARYSPILKPANWQHIDNEILGVIYGVEAQYLDGTKIDLQNEKIPDDAFELVVYGVIYKYTFPEYAEEIQKRSDAGLLCVSMETWFSDYAYAILDHNGSMSIVERTEGNAILDRNLRCFGGGGKYNGKRIGRALKNLTFGGMGFVDQPANPTSFGLVHASQQTEIIMEEKNIKEAVERELDAREAKRAEAAVVSGLKTDIENLKKDNAVAAENATRAEEKAEKAELAKNLSEAILAAIDEKLDSSIAELGADAPAEIAKIDSAESADAKFAAKIAFLMATAKEVYGSASAELVKENEELKAKVAAFEAEKAEAEKVAKVAARKADVVELLGDSDEAEVEKVLAGLVDLSDEDYAARLDMLKVVAKKARPTVELDGSRGSPEEEGASGESKIKSAPREDVQVSVASLEDATVEETVEPEGGKVETESAFAGMDKVLIRSNKKSNKE